jgi:hypothetical protein
VGEPLEPPTAEHLTDCSDCAARYADLQRFMDGLRTEADAELDAAFSPDRLRAQRERIAHRLALLAHPGRVITFPGYRPAPRAAAIAARPRVAPRWVVAAAAASLAFGVGLGSSMFRAGTTDVASAPAATIAPARPAAAADIAAAPPSAPIVASTDAAFLSELELALERPHTSELVALDELTPHVRGVVYQVR